jgi:hypothetical protein
VTTGEDSFGVPVRRRRTSGGRSPNITVVALVGRQKLDPSAVVIVVSKLTPALFYRSNNLEAA